MRKKDHFSSDTREISRRRKCFPSQRARNMIYGCFWSSKVHGCLRRGRCFACIREKALRPKTFRLSDEIFQLQTVFNGCELWSHFFRGFAFSIELERELFPRFRLRWICFWDSEEHADYVKDAQAHFWKVRKSCTANVTRLRIQALHSSSGSLKFT